MLLCNIFKLKKLVTPFETKNVDKKYIGTAGEMLILQWWAKILESENYPWTGHAN